MSAEELKAQGNQAFAAKDFEKAAKLFSDAIAASSEPNHVLYSNRSACYTSLKNFVKGLKDAEECTRINPSWAKGYNRVAAANYGLGNFDDARIAYNKALEIEPSNKMAKDGLEQIEQSEMARSAQPDMGLGAIFSDPNLISKLKSNPKTSELMKDPALVQKVLQMQQNPQAMSGEFLKDQRLMTIMATLMGIDLSMPDMSSAPTSSAGNQTDNVPLEKAEKTSTKSQQESHVEKEAESSNDVEMKDASEQDESKALKEKADSFKAEGNKLYKQRKFDEAIDNYNKAWETVKDITYLNNRAAAEFEKNDFETTIKTCEHAVEQGRELRADYKIVAKSFARIGNAYIKLLDYKKAIEFFEKSLTEHRTPDVLSKLRSAEKEYKKQQAANYIDPEKAEEARLEGKEFFTKGDWPNAIKSYTEMVKRSPDDARGYSNRAAALAKLMSFPEAVQDCNKAIELDPAFIRAYIRKANAQLAMREYSGCLETLEAARMKDLDLESKNIYEIDQLYNKAMSQRFSAIEGETPEQTMERVSRDPEVTSILQDPIMQNILAQAKENPAALQDHMKNPEVFKKINILIAAGIIRTR